MKTYFNLNQIDYQSLAKVGIKEKDLLNRPADVEKLLSGKMTDFFTLQIKDPKINLQGKLSMKQVGDQAIIQIHPIMKNIDKTYDFSKQEIKELEKGEVIKKEVDGKPMLFQLDLDTKTVMKADPKFLRLPNSVAGRELSNEEKVTLRNAGKVNFPGGKIKIDFQSLNNVTTERQLNIDLNKNNEIGR